eukprot:SAG31_NODE_47274_length_251_cov_0.664474_1_plen_52_part_10
MEAALLLGEMTTPASESSVGHGEGGSEAGQAPNDGAEAAPDRTAAPPNHRRG